MWGSRSPQRPCSSILISVDSPEGGHVMSQDGVRLVPSMFPKQVFGLCLKVIPQIRMQGTHVSNARDLEWRGASGAWWGGGQICVLVVSGACQARLVSAPDTGASENSLPKGLLGLTRSCRFCDLARFLVSQKPLSLCPRWCLRPCPVITGCRGGLPGVRSDTVSAHGCHHSGGRGRGRAGGGGPKHAQFLITACT